MTERLIAIELFHKHPNTYRPVDDPIVRRSADILRGRLERYYATEGVSDRIIFTIPRRTYVVQADHNDSVPFEPKTFSEQLDEDVAEAANQLANFDPCTLWPHLAPIIKGFRFEIERDEIPPHATMDAHGHLKLPHAYNHFFTAINNRNVFLTTFEGRVGRIYPIAAWILPETLMVYAGPQRFTEYITAYQLGLETKVSATGLIAIPKLLREALSITGPDPELRIWFAPTGFFAFCNNHDWHRHLHGLTTDVFPEDDEAGP